MEGMPQTDPSEVAELRRAVAVLSREVATLADRAARLALAVEGLAPPAESSVNSQGRTANTPNLQTTESSGTVPYRVVVSPVSELALVAVAETTLRGMPEVRRVSEITQTNEQTSFDLEIEPGTDVAEPLRAALPVPFQVVASTGAELVISLRPIWGSADRE